MGNLILLSLLVSSTAMALGTAAGCNPQARTGLEELPFLTSTASCTTRGVLSREFGVDSSEAGQSLEEGVGFFYNLGVASEQIQRSISGQAIAGVELGFTPDEIHQMALECFTVSTTLDSNCDRNTVRSSLRTLGEGAGRMNTSDHRQDFDEGQRALYSQMSLTSQVLESQLSSNLNDRVSTAELSNYFVGPDGRLRRSCASEDKRGAIAIAMASRASIDGFLGELSKTQRQPSLCNAPVAREEIKRLRSSNVFSLSPVGEVLAGWFVDTPGEGEQVKDCQGFRTLLGRYVSFLNEIRSMPPAERSSLSPAGLASIQQRINRLNQDIKAGATSFTQNDFRKQFHHSCLANQTQFRKAACTPPLQDSSAVAAAGFGSRSGLEAYRVGVPLAGIVAGRHLPRVTNHLDPSYLAELSLGRYDQMCHLVKDEKGRPQLLPFDLATNPSREPGLEIVVSGTRPRQLTCAGYNEWLSDQCRQNGLADVLRCHNDPGHSFAIYCNLPDTERGPGTDCNVVNSTPPSDVYANSATVLADMPSSSIFAPQRVPVNPMTPLNNMVKGVGPAGALETNAQPGQVQAGALPFLPISNEASSAAATSGSASAGGDSGPAAVAPATAALTPVAAPSADAASIAALQRTIEELRRKIQETQIPAEPPAASDDEVAPVARRRNAGRSIASVEAGGGDVQRSVAATASGRSGSGLSAGTAGAAITNTVASIPAASIDLGNFVSSASAAASTIRTYVPASSSRNLTATVGDVDVLDRNGQPTGRVVRLDGAPADANVQDFILSRLSPAQRRQAREGRILVQLGEGGAFWSVALSANGTLDAQRVNKEEAKRQMNAVYSRFMGILSSARSNL